MLASKLFYTDRYTLVQQRILAFLNSQEDFLSAGAAQSPRAVGDAVQSLLGDSLETLMESYGVNYSISFARRAMADLAFEDADDFYYVVDVKTHRLDTAFNMPNLISVERLSRFYEEDKNYFVVLMVAYTITGTQLDIARVQFVPVEFLSWKCLTIGALGWGQIQIANANVIEIVPQNSRKSWMIELCDTLLEFYPREIGKINGRIAHFERVRDQWAQRASDLQLP